MDNINKENFNKHISQYIEFLSNIPSKGNNLESWIPICVECLQFTLDNEQLLNENPKLYQDALRTLHLLDSFIVEKEEWAYIVLKQKFKKYHSPEKIARAFKEVLKRLKAENE